MNRAGGLRRRKGRATLVFQSGWNQVQKGEIRPGGTLVIQYDSTRLTQCRRQWRQVDIWHIECSVRFHPSGEIHTDSVLQDVREPPDSGPVVGHVAKPISLSVPVDATQIELWFRTFREPGPWDTCEGWDSCFGQNYWFAVRA